MYFESVLPNLYVLYGELSANTYLLLGNEPLLIDPGVHDKDYLLGSLKKLGVKEEDIKIILLTHSHADHFINCKSFSKAKIYCSENAIKLFKVKDNIATVSLWLHNTYFPQDLHVLKNKEIIGNDNFQLQVIETNGHTLNDIAFYDKEKKLLFSGDTLFRGAFGRVDLFDSSKSAMLVSLHKLEKLNFEYLCAGHGKVFKASKQEQKENVMQQLKYLERM